jgi:hypothetical protein
MKPRLVLLVTNLALLAAWLGACGRWSWVDGH